ncbi:hypothetical protein BaRGS_00030999 [Batillaria attramentaria]|uniref:Uncharacterized protein n=1 Tax=Batillaria attramentaria TaxID=370345 RepID=A0ABD0JRT2_9CAEN
MASVEARGWEQKPGGRIDACIVRVGFRVPKRERFGMGGKRKLCDRLVKSQNAHYTSLTLASRGLAIALKQKFPHQNNRLPE